MAATIPEQRSPSDEVFNTTEILEEVLLGVNCMQTVLLSQRVSTSFYSTINGSFKLRRALWLEPTPPNERSRRFPGINPLLAKHHTRLIVPTLTINNQAQNRTDMLGRYHFLEVRVIAKNDNSTWMRMVPFQTKELRKWALACAFICEEADDRDRPARWTWWSSEDDLWLDPQDCEEYVGKERFITKCRMLGRVKEPMTIREMFEAAMKGRSAQRETGLSLEEQMEELEVDTDSGDDSDAME